VCVVVGGQQVVKEPKKEVKPEKEVKKEKKPK